MATATPRPVNLIRASGEGGDIADLRHPAADEQTPERSQVGPQGREYKRLDYIPEPQSYYRSRETATTRFITRIFWQALH